MEKQHYNVGCLQLGTEVVYQLPDCILTLALKTSLGVWLTAAAPLKKFKPFAICSLGLALSSTLVLWLRGLSWCIFFLVINMLYVQI